MKEKFYETIVSPTMTYGFECQALDKKKIKTKFVKMKMLK